MRLQSPGHALEAAPMFVIVRHGNTFEAGTQPRRIGARTDLALTGEGKAQAQRLAEHFAQKGMRFDRVMISPLLRTRQTAEAILAAQDNPPEPQTCNFLREVDYGPDENCLEAEVLARIGQDALDGWEQRGEIPTGWIVEPEMRIKAWRDLFADASADAETTLLVTSNGAARYALLADPALEREAARLKSLKLPTGGYGVIGCDVGGLRLECWGERP